MASYFVELEKSELASTLAAARTDAAAGLALDADTWRPLLRGWATNGAVTLSEEALEAAAAALVTRLWPAVPELLKHDLAESEGKAFAAYQTQAFGLILRKLEAAQPSSGFGSADWKELEGWIVTL